MLENKKLILRKREHNVNKLILVLAFFLLSITAIILANNVNWISLNVDLVSFLKLILIILGSYLIASLFIKLTHKRVYKLFDESVGVEHKILLNKFYTAVVYLFATAVVFWNLGVTLENLTLIVGLIATGLAFALREILLPIFVWFLLLTKKPFRIGDYIKIGDDEGIVKHIGTFYVFLIPLNTDLQQEIKIPNKLFLDKNTINYGSDRLPIFLKLPITALSELHLNEEKIEVLKKNLREIYPEYIINPKLISEKEYIYMLFDFKVSKNENYTKIRHKIYEQTYKYFKGPR